VTAGPTGATGATGPGSGSPASAALEIARDIKLAHSVFALPFAALGATFAAVHAGPHGARTDVAWPSFATSAALVLACMVSARTAAMIANRLLDRAHDARNPRTAGRALPAGRLTVRAAVAGLALSSAVFVGGAVLFGVLQGNWWPAALALPVLAWITAYGLFKRFTALCHVWLGASLAISPVAAALAVAPGALERGAPWLMACMVLCWVAGFDVIYALQDVEVDRREGLHSLPSRLGVPGALRCARALHAAALGFLVALWVVVPEFGAWFGAAVAVVAVLLAVEHATVHRWGTTRIAATFTTVNGAVSLAVGAAGVASLLA
jgi:4-hydroxybenzoate polyprenyltransferase